VQRLEHRSDAVVAFADPALGQALQSFGFVAGKTLAGPYALTVEVRLEFARCRSIQ
jgi:hypothetical protein